MLTKHLLKFLIVRQTHILGCGIACIISVARFYNIDVSQKDIAKTVRLGWKGISFMDILFVFKNLDIKAVGIFISNEIIESLPCPFIAHLKYFNFFHHFVVVLNVSHESVVIMNPDIGRIYAMDKVKFLKFWTQKTIVFNLFLE